MGKYDQVLITSKVVISITYIYDVFISRNLNLANTSAGIRSNIIDIISHKNYKE